MSILVNSCLPCPKYFWINLQQIKSFLIKKVSLNEISKLNSHSFNWLLNRYLSENEIAKRTHLSDQSDVYFQIKVITYQRLENIQLSQITDPSVLCDLIHILEILYHTKLTHLC